MSDSTQWHRHEPGEWHKRNDSIRIPFPDGLVEFLEKMDRENAGFYEDVNLGEKK